MTALLMALTACASMEGKFSSTRKADIGIFADNTIAILSDANFGFAKKDTTYTREFYDFSAEEEKHFVGNARVIERVIQLIVGYSLKIVTISEAGGDEVTQINEYADYLAEFDDEIIEALDFEKSDFDQRVADIRSQETFMEALRTAQPLVNHAGRYMEEVLDVQSDALTALQLKTDQKIDARYAEVIAYQRALETEKYEVLRALGQLYGTYRGDDQAFNNLRASGAIRDEELLPKGKPTKKELKALADHLVNRLDVMHRIGEEIQPDWDIYRKTHRELVRLVGEVDSEIKRIRLVTLVWVRAHQKMASGTVSPAAWFDISDTPAELMKLGTKAIF